jgi:hypothetical protein
MVPFAKIIVILIALAWITNALLMPLSEEPAQP